MSGLRLRVGGSNRTALRAELHSRGVLLNTYAETLLDHRAFDLRAPEQINVVECTVSDLGLRVGATLSGVFAAAREHGLELCPADTGPYLRLAMSTQANAPDSILSAGRSPSGALKVAATRLTDDVAFPTGFYLRVVDGRQWLRGFRCDNEYLFGLDDRFAFRLP